MQYPELMLEKEAKLLYHEWLTKNCHSKKKCQVEETRETHKAITIRQGFIQGF